MQNDNLVASIVSECLHVMRDQATQTKLTACYTLTAAVTRLLCVCGDKDWVLGFVDEFCAELKKEVEEHFI